MWTGASGGGEWFSSGTQRSKEQRNNEENNIDLIPRTFPQEHNKWALSPTDLRIQAEGTWTKIKGTGEEKALFLKIFAGILQKYK